MELRNFLAMVRRWMWLLILGLILGSAAGYFGSRYQTPLYQASTRLMVIQASQSQNADPTGLDGQQLTQNYIQLLTTQPVLDEASSHLGYAIDAKQLNVQQVSTTQIIQLTVEDSSPDHAAAIANTLVTSLISQNENLQSGRYTSTEQSLQTQIGQVQTQIASLQTTINDISTSAVTDQINQVQTQINSLQTQINALTTQYKGLKQQWQTPDVQTQEQNIQAQITQLQTVQTSYQQVYTSLVVQGQPVANAENSTSTRLSQLQSTLSQYQQVYVSLLNNLESVKLAGLQNTPNVVQIEAAAVPTDPVQPRPVVDTLLAAMVGLMLAGGVGFVVEYLDNTIKTVEDVERVLGLSVIGYIAEMQYSKGHREVPYVMSEPRSPVSEAFRLLRTNLEFSGVDKPLRKILVTSAGPSEGKSTVATNLAVIMAQGGKRVLLMDADMRKPRIHHLLGLRNNVGLSDLFRGKLADSVVIQRCPGQTGVSVITSGRLAPNPAELLGSARMEQILTDMLAQTDVLIIDGPPSLVADVQVLASKVDGVLVVIQPGHTPADEAQAMFEQLNRAGARIVGVVFNRIPRNRFYYYGGYRHYSPYYNRGYNYSYTPEDHHDRKDPPATNKPVPVLPQFDVNMNLNGEKKNKQSVMSDRTTLFPMSMPHEK